MPHGPLTIITLLLSSTAALPLTAQTADNEPADNEPADIEPVDLADATQATDASLGHAFSLSVFFENDGAKISIDSTDRNYTNGAGLALAWREDPDNLCFDPWLVDVADPRMAGGLTIGQLMYTPDNIQATAPLPDQHPYLGYLYVGGFAQRTFLDEGTPTFEHLELDLGVVGPSSLAEEAQKEVHRLVDEALPMGWINQDGDEFAFEFTYVRKWRFDLIDTTAATWGQTDALNGPAGEGWGAQVIPALRFRAGTIAVDAEADVLARWGWNLPDDFGPANLLDLPDYTGLGLSSGWSFYGFVGASARATAHDITWDGGLFDPGKVSVDGNPVTGSARFGLAGGYRNDDGFSMQLNWTMRYTSERYDGQEGWDRLGQVGVTMRWVY